MADDLHPEDFDMQRRRTSDLPSTSTDLILYQLSEVKAAVREGFQKMEGRFDRVEARITTLERFRERLEERDRAAARAEGNISGKLVALITTVVTVGGGIIYVVLSGGPH